MSEQLTEGVSPSEALEMTFEEEAAAEIELEREEDVLEEAAEIEPEREESVSEEEDSSELDPVYEESDQSTDGEGEAPEVQAFEEHAPEEHAPETKIRSMSGDLLWTLAPQDSGATENTIKMKPGPTKFATSRAKDIKSTFQLFLTESIEKIILKTTNAEGKRKLGDTWGEIDQVDLQAFIGLLILGGVCRSDGESTNDLWDAELGRPIFGATMSVKQFCALSGMIRFDDRGTRHNPRRNDKLAAIRDVWDMWVERLPWMYNPGPEVTVENVLFPFRGRCPFKVYIPNKPPEYGIKVWAVCDACSSYAWNMQVYVGKPSTGKAEENQGMRAVLEMTTGLRGHNITCGSYFTSYALGQELLKRKITMIGAVRKNTPELPPALFLTKGRQARKRHSSKVVFTDTHTLVSYVPNKKRTDILMSTRHRNVTFSSTMDRKPLMFQDYERNKGGFDKLNKLLGTYSCKRMTARWPLSMFYSILNVSAYNAFVVWTAMNPTLKSEKGFNRRIFLEELGKALVTPCIQRRQHLPRTRACASLVRSVQAPAAALANTDPNPEVSKIRRRCGLCVSRDKRDSKTRLRCCKCAAYVCKRHSVLTVKCHSCA